MIKYISNTANYNIRTETHQGKKHLVVPVVMMVEGVHNGSHGAVFHSAEELGKIPGSWNGIPVTIDHPIKNDEFVPANDPEMIDKVTVGRIYNTKMDGIKLIAEAWIDEKKCREVSIEALGYIRNKKPLEVSVGVFSEEIEEKGIWNNEEYETIAINHRPDHLALLPGGVGACSWSDGCGIRVNEKGGKMNVNSELLINALKYSGTESTPWSKPTLRDFDVEDSNWEGLSSTDKGKVVSHYLIGSATVETFGDLKFPVVNPKNGNLNENALRAVIGGRGAQVKGFSDEVRSAARKRAYRLLNSEFDAELKIPENLEALTDSLKMINEMGYSVNKIGFHEIGRKISQKLFSMNDNEKNFYLEEVFDDSFIYNIHKMGEDSYFKQMYVINNNDVEFVGEPMEVERRLEFIPILQTNKKEDKQMSEQQKLDLKTPCQLTKVEQLINNEQTRFTEEDKEWLLTQEEAVLDKLLPIEQPKEKLQINNDEVINAFKEKAKTTDDFINLMPTEMQDQIRSGLRLHQDARKKMIDHIIANAKDVWNEDQLKEMDTDILTKVYKSVPNPVDYSAMNVINNEEDNEEKMLPVGVEIKEQRKED